MVIGNASKKLQTMVELAEELYERVTELREKLAATQETVDDTNDRVAALARELDRQRALLEAVAEEHGVDPDDVIDDEEAIEGVE